MALAERLFIDEVPAEQDLARHTLECLAWLIVQNRLVLKVARNAKRLVSP